MSFLPPGENIIETKKCRISGKDFFVTDRDLEFYDKISPVFGGQKYLIPSPTLCPDERMRRRLSWRNERKLYHGKCAKTGNQIISTYSHDKDYTIYDPKVWNSDDWNPGDFYADFDFSRPFFSQFDSLMKRTPKPALANGFGENADYCNQCYYLKNCYLCFCTDYCEDCEYLYGSFESKNCFDGLNIAKCEYCYECIGCTNCFDAQECIDCRDSRDILFCFDCSGCHDCFGCTNLRNKSYYFFNELLTEEEYKKRVEEYRKSSEKIQTPMRARVKDFMKNAIYRDTNNINCESCTGDFLHGCKNTYSSFSAKWLIDCKYISLCPGEAHNSYDIVGSLWAWDYECVSVDGNNIGFSAYIYPNNTNVYYSHFVNSSHDLFGCSSLKKWHHCIMNQSFGVQEYEKLCGKIIDHMRSTGEWWEFFPTEMSPFGYDETVAIEHFPLSQSEAQKKWWKWKWEEETSSYHGPYYTALPIQEYDEKIVGHEKAQGNIDALLNWILRCEKTEKPFKIIRQELAFHIENHIPLPKKHPDERYLERLGMRNPRTLHERTCAECGAHLITTYSPERTERIVCEACYQRLVY